MAPSISMLSLGCVLNVVLGAVPDLSSFVQTGVQSQLAQQQALMFRMVAEAMGSKAAKPHKHHKHHSDDDEDEHHHHHASKTEEASDIAADAAAQKVVPTVNLFKHNRNIFALKRATDVEASCSKGDFDNFVHRFNEIQAQNGSAIEESMKENDPIATLGLVEKLVPEECGQEKLMSATGVNFANLETCLTKGTGISKECVACPLNFIYSTIGKSLVDMPFTCAMKCTPLATSAVKCGEAADCDPEILTKAAKCMKCVAPNVLELHQCAQLPYAPNTEGRLTKLFQATLEGEDALEQLLQAEVADGRDELQIVSDKPPLAKFMALFTSILVD